jgi:hypothetical protein
MVPALGPNAIRSSRSAPPTERQLPPRIAKMWIAYRNCHRLTKEFLGRKSCVSLIERRGMHSKPSLPPLTRKGHSGIRVRRFVECILREILLFPVSHTGLCERIQNTRKERKQSVERKENHQAPIYQLGRQQSEGKDANCATHPAIGLRVWDAEFENPLLSEISPSLPV